MKRITGFFVLLAALQFGVLAYAEPLEFSANLNGATEVPPTPSLGVGTATVFLDPVVNTLSVNVTFSGLSAPTTASHIHCCLPSPGAVANAEIATTVPTFPGFPLGVTSGTYSRSFDLTNAGTYNPAFVADHGGTISSAEAALIAGIEAKESYLNIHSTQFPTGEIRGILVSVPEPSTLLLLAIGVFGMVRFRKKI